MAAATAVTVNSAASWLTDSFSQLYRASGTLDTASVATGAQTTDTVAVPGVVLGDIVLATSFSLSLQGLVRTAYVSAADTVTIVTFNNTGGTIDLASGTVKVLVGRPVF